jgi:glycosyltransferase involved in cell wall biosynthesis
VVASNRGSLPEVTGSAGILIDPRDVTGLSSAMERLLDDEAASAYGAAGLERARAFTWSESANTLRRAYTDAVGRRQAAR